MKYNLEVGVSEKHGHAECSDAKTKYDRVAPAAVPRSRQFDGVGENLMRQEEFFL